MYGFKALSILSLRGTGKVKGFCNKDGIGSLANHLNTEELNIMGMEFKNSYKQPENYIMKIHITTSCQRHLICKYKRKFTIHLQNILLEPITNNIHLISL